MTKIITLSIIGIAISLAGLFLFLNGELWMFFSYLLSVVGFSFIVCACYDEGYNSCDKKCHIAKLVIMSIALMVSLYPFFCCFDWFVQIGGRCVSLLYGYETYSRPYEGGLIVFFANMCVTSFFAYGIIEEIKSIPKAHNKSYKLNAPIKVGKTISPEDMEKANEARLARAKILEEQRGREKQEMDELTAKYGELTKMIDISQSYYQSKAPLSNSIMIFDTTNTIKIRKQVFSYKDILSCSIIDNGTTNQTTSTQTATTKTDTGNMLGRAIVGGILTGGVGAVVGAATAKKTTTTSSPQVNIIVTHDYTIQINVNSITEPLIKIHIGEDEDKVNEIVPILNVIIHRNSQINQ